MFACKNCGGNIIYDIREKKLVCRICHSSFAPENITKENDSVDYDFFETTIFTCPQCGAKIMCEDNEASSFCTYCSSSTVLTSRIAKEKKPDYIIPFEKTKEECIGEFKKITRRAIFAPGELKDEKILDKFKAIYIPYWFYDVTQDSHFNLTGAEKASDGRTAFTYFYDVKGNIKGRFEGICKDASYNFSDDLGERIAPFFTDQKKKFYPSYLSGFYADVSDIPPEVYEHEAIETANDVAREIVSQESCKGDYSKMKVYASNDEATKQFGTKVDAKRALFPVWFMSFKKGKKVAYMTVNGQTGKAASDFPIAIPKFLLGVLILTLLFFPLAILGLYLFSSRASFAALDTALIMSAVSYVIYYAEMKILQIKDSGSEDAGKFYKKTNVVYIKNKDKNEILKRFLKESIIDIAMGLIYIFMICWYVIFIGNVMSSALGSKTMFTADGLSTALKVVLVAGNIILAVIGMIRASKLKTSSKYYGALFGMILMAAVLAMVMIAPQSVIMSIVCCILLAAGAFMTVFDLIKYHNELTMRQPSHLKRRGGDVIADDINL